MDIGNVEAFSRVFFYCRLSQTDSLVCRIVEYLNFQFLTRVIDLCDGLQQTVDNVHFVVERQLDRYLRQVVLFELTLWLRHEFAVAPEVNDQFDAIATVDCEDSQDRNTESGWSNQTHPGDKGG